MSKRTRNPLRTRPFQTRAAVALLRAVREPRLFSELVEKLVHRKIVDPKHKIRLSEYAQYAVSLEDAVSTATSIGESKVKELLTERPLKEGLLEASRRAALAGVPSRAQGGFVELCYVLCRILKPAVAFETGVAYGWTTACILQAMETNGAGHLHSIDLPAFAPGSRSYTGLVVPDRLKHRWSLHIGPQSRLLPTVLQACPSVNFFHYDSDKTYSGMIATYQTVWRHLAPGAVLMSDDLNNDAFLDFAEAWAIKPLVVVEPGEGKRVGVIVHP